PPPPPALCRKVAETPEGGTIEIWGDGRQTRSFLFVDDCLDATLRLTRSENFAGPVNIGSEEMVTINDLARIVMDVAAKPLGIRHIPGPQGVRGRNSHNDLIREKLGWEPRLTLREGIARTYPWIARQVEAARGRNA
ncbi:MAG: NAD-dependent epimerase/dehydratase family protein, partial [Gemmobacter sp.]